MKLVKQIILYLRDGKSDKVYEVDLCEVADGEYVVNFRYGRRGAALREGTKTIFPVNRGDAEKVYSSLIDSKTRKGYSENIPTQESVTPIETEEELPVSDDVIANSILKRLSKCVDGTNNEKKWQTSRIVWRAGLLKIKEAAPFVEKLCHQKDSLFQYCALWTLGRCGTIENLPVVLASIQNIKTSPMVKRIAYATAMALSSQVVNRDIVSPLIHSLPDSINNSFENKESSEIYRFLEENLFDKKQVDNGYLTTLYLLSKSFPFIREPILFILPQIPLKPNYFRELRYIYKLAEFRDDEKVLGILNHSIEVNPSFYMGEGYVLIEGDYFRYNRQELKKPNSKLAYSDKTRNYFIKRSLRSLLHYGEQGSSFYTKLAREMLLQFDDKNDETKPTTKSDYDYRNGRWSEVVTHYDSFHKYKTFYFILYANSTRYESAGPYKVMKCKSPYKPGDAGPEEREEAFSELWDQDPDSLIHLLKESKCGRVHEFAIKVLKTFQNINEMVTIEDLKRFILSPYQCTVSFTIELAQKLFDPNQPDFDLIESFFSCSVVEGREVAKNWVDASKFDFRNQVGLFANLFFSKWVDNRDWVKVYLVRSNNTSDVNCLIIDEILSACLRVDKNIEDLLLFESIAQVIIEIYPNDSAKIKYDVLEKLIYHSLDQVKNIGAKLLVVNDIRPEKVSEEVFKILLESKLIGLQSLGIELIGKLEDHYLMNRVTALRSACVSSFSEVRKVAFPIMGRLARSSSDVRKELLSNLLPLLLKKETVDGLHEDLNSFFATELLDSLKALDVAMQWKFLTSKYLPANFLGLELIRNLLNPTDLGMKKIISLAHHELEEVRAFGQSIFNNHIDFIKEKKSEAIRIFETDWDSIRTFAFDYFRGNFADSDWSPILIVSIVDSVRPDVQNFGKELITRFFKEDQGEEYLLKLCQHPSSGVQLFSTNFLEKNAKDQPDVLYRLELFFVSVLSLVNQGRVARIRILAFLKEEALKDEMVARFVTRILNNASLTNSIENKAICIETLLEIKNKYPEIDTLVIKIETPVYVQGQI